MQKQLGRNTVVLLGVGHTNAHVLRMWKMQQPKNAQLVCVSDFPVVTYSGMLPGVISGQYPKQAMEIDLVRLAHSTGARLIVDRVTGLDKTNRQLTFANRTPLRFDVLSIGIGSIPSFANVSIDDQAPLLAVKPMQTFLQRLGQRLSALDRATTRPKIVIVGGGVGSIEIAFCLHERFFGNPQNKATEWPTGLKPAISVVTASRRLGSGLLDTTVATAQREFDRREIQVQLSSRVSHLGERHLTFVDGRQCDADIVIWATGAVGAPLLRHLELDTDERGFLLTKPDLETVSKSAVFAVGDSGTIVNSTTPKAGVYAVRQGPILFDNILKVIRNEGSLDDYRPQTDFLKLINLGNGRAIAEYHGRSYSGRWCWKLKDYIDVKFMRKYQAYEQMPMTLDPDESPPMKCLGCGGKIGSQILSQVLAELQLTDDPDVRIGLHNPDDAAVIAVHDNEVTVTTDFFAAPFDDPWLIGRIAALNAASDCFVMGAQPTSALAIVQIPTGHPSAQLQVMREVMAGGIEEFRKMPASIVGGHSIEGPRLMIGYTVLGRQITAAKTKGMLQPGDQLVLSKPIGTGVLLAAWMRSEMSAEYFQPLINAMLASNQIALEILKRFPVTGMTDVTGFGLAGHLSEMLIASGVAAEIWMNRIPLLPGCQQLFDLGLQSTLAPDNRTFSDRIVLPGIDIAAKEFAALFDPQTSGGLLFGIRESYATAVVKFLADHGFAQAAVVGQAGSRSALPELAIQYP